MRVASLQPSAAQALPTNRPLPRNIEIASTLLSFIASPLQWESVLRSVGHGASRRLRISPKQLPDPLTRKIAPFPIIRGGACMARPSEGCSPRQGGGLGPHPEELDGMMPVIYDELKRLAARHLRRQAPGHNPQTNAP